MNSLVFYLNGRILEIEFLQICSNIAPKCLMLEKFTTLQIKNEIILGRSSHRELVKIFDFPLIYLLKFPNCFSHC